MNKRPHQTQSHQPYNIHQTALSTAPEEVVNIHLSTLKSYFHAKSNERAFTLTYTGVLDTDFERKLDTTTKEIMDSGTILVSEFIKRDHDGNVYVCLDLDQVDTHFMNVAFEMLERYNIKSGQFVAISEPKQFHSTDMTFLTRH